jgi:hypothetical protein
VWPDCFRHVFVDDGNLRTMKPGPDRRRPCRAAGLPAFVSSGVEPVSIVNATSGRDESARAFGESVAWRQECVRRSVEPHRDEPWQAIVSVVGEPGHGARQHHLASGWPRSRANSWMFISPICYPVGAGADTSRTSVNVCGLRLRLPGTPKYRTMST